MEVSCTAEEFLAAEDELQICSGLFDSADPKWKEKGREEVLKNHKSISTEATPAKQFHVEDSDEEEEQTPKNQSLNRKTRRYDYRYLKCRWNIPDIMDKKVSRINCTTEKTIPRVL